MFSGVIVLSSDDEDDSWLAAKHKRIKIQPVDADISLIEKVPNRSEIALLEENAPVCPKRTQAKPLSDDDCCILSYDPNNSASIPEFQANDADEIVIVGERGPVACRDFPHARHLCVKFPYATTPHEKHCEQCHCYVCDVSAPCMHWGQGKQNSDHCNASDKDDKWKKLRIQTRSRLAKLSTRPQVSIQQEKAVHLQPRSIPQPRLRVVLPPRHNDSPHPSNRNGSVISVNRGAHSLSDVHRHSYSPLNQSGIPANSLHWNQVDQEKTPQCMENSFNAIEKQANASKEYRNCLTKNAAIGVPSAAPQSGHQQQWPTMLPVAHTTMQAKNWQERSISLSSCVTGIQSEGQPSNFMTSDMQRYQGQRVGSFTEVSYNHPQLLPSATTERFSKKYAVPPIRNIAKDLMTLQRYLLEGIGDGRQYHTSSVHESNMKETGYPNFSVQRPLPMPQNGEMETSLLPSGSLERLPLGSSEVPPPGIEVAGMYSAHGSNTGLNKQVDKDVFSIPSDGARNKKNTEDSLNDGSELSNTSPLDLILAGFDDELWTLLEPAAYSGF